MKAIVSLAALVLAFVALVAAHCGPLGVRGAVAMNALSERLAIWADA